MSSESIYFQCVVEYACNQIWLGKDPLYWLTKIGGLEDSYIPSGDLAVKTTLCYFITQLHLHLKSVENGEETFYNTKQFCEHFSIVKTFFPYSSVEMASMDEKIKEWTTKTNVTVPECKKMIKEMKIFLQPVYKKFENPQANKAFEVYQKKLKSNKIHPNANALKEVFLWMFRGSSSDAEKEWEEITKTKHPDVTQLKRNLALPLTASGPKDGPRPRGRPRKRNGATGVDFINTIPGCSTNIQDSLKSIAVSKKSVPVNSKGKQPVNGKKLTNGKERSTPTSQHSSITSDSNDTEEHPLVNHADEMLESSEGVVGPSQEINYVTNLRNNGKCQNITTKIRGKPANLKRSITNGKNTPCKSPEKIRNQTVEIASEETITNKQSTPCKSPKEARNQTVESTSKETTSSQKLEMPVGQMLSLTCQLSKAEELVQATNAVNSSLEDATRNLRKIVKDPYEKKIQHSDEEIQTVTKRKKPKWLASQENAGVLHWSSSECGDVSEDDCKKTGDKQPKKKKKRKRYWTAEEMDWIRDGLKKYGIGNWATILKNYPFVDRSSVDIKDKYRNMVRNAEI